MACDFYDLAYLDTHKMNRKLIFKRNDNPRMKTGSARLRDYWRSLGLATLTRQKYTRINDAKETLTKEQNDGRLIPLNILEV